MSKSAFEKLLDEVSGEGSYARALSLMREESRWQRKLTIATNKLNKVRKEKDKLLLELAGPPKNAKEKSRRHE